MKLFRKIPAGLFILGGFIAISILLHAQETDTTSIQVAPLSLTPTDLQALTSLSAAQVTALVSALDATPTIPAESLPGSGTFWSLANPAWPPLPGNVNGLAAWQMNGGNAYLLNDVDFDYTASARPQTGMRMMSYSGPPGFDDIDTNGVGTNTYSVSSYTVIDYGTNLWIAQVGLSAGNLVGIVTNSQADILYEIQSTLDLAPPAAWNSEGFLYGSELTNWTAAVLARGNRTNLFLRIRSWIDNTGTGIPDWWWLDFFGQTTNVDAYASAAGDGYDNLDKFEMELNPTNYYNPNAPGGFFGYLDPSGTNAFVMWKPSPGPVANYLIQRGVYNVTLSNYTYSQIGTVSSNATFFKDTGAITNANSLNNLYSVQAAYPGGSLSPATATWQVSWYSNYASYGPPYGPPMPGNVYAYADVTGTNILLSWTLAQGAATNYIFERGIFNLTNYDYTYTPIAHFSTNTTSFTDTGAITNDDGWNNIYQIQAVYPGGGLSYPADTYSAYPVSVSINVGSGTNGPAAPTGFYGYADSAVTNMFLTWNPVSGSVTNYFIYGGIYDYDTALYVYHKLGQVNASTNSFEVVGGIDDGGNTVYDVYNVVAVYPGGSLSQSAFWYPNASAPAPGALSAYLDITGTNALLSWTPAVGAASYIIQKSDDYGNYGSFYQIDEVSSNTTAYEDVDGVASGYDGANSIVYEVQATYPNGGLSPAISAALSTNLPAPASVTATVDATGTNVLVSWNPAVGIVSGYVILRGTYNQSTGTYSYSQVGSVGAGATTFQDTGAFTGNTSYNNIYQVQAVYAGGRFSAVASSSVSRSSVPPTYNINVTAQLVRNQSGHWQLIFSSIPTNVEKIAFYWYVWDLFYDIGPFPASDSFNNGVPLTTETDIPVSSLTNGVYVMPDFLMTNWFPNSYVGKVALVQPISTNNQYGNLIQVGFQHYDSPCFVDGRQHLKQNLLFELRAATISQPIGLAEPNVWFDPWFTSIYPPTDTNYVESSIFHESLMYKGYSIGEVAYWPCLDLVDRK